MRLHLPTSVQYCSFQHLTTRKRAPLANKPKKSGLARQDPDAEPKAKKQVRFQLRPSSPDYSPPSPSPSPIMSSHLPDKALVDNPDDIGMREEPICRLIPVTVPRAPGPAKPLFSKAHMRGKAKFDKAMDYDPENPDFPLLNELPPSGMGIDRPVLVGLAGTNRTPEGVSTLLATKLPPWSEGRMLIEEDVDLYYSEMAFRREEKWEEAKAERKRREEQERKQREARERRAEERGKKGPKELTYKAKEEGDGMLSTLEEARENAERILLATDPVFTRVPARRFKQASQEEEQVLATNAFFASGLGQPSKSPPGAKKGPLVADREIVVISSDSEEGSKEALYSSSDLEDGEVREPRKPKRTQRPGKGSVPIRRKPSDSEEDIFRFPAYKGYK